MIILKSILTTFEASSIFEKAGAVAKIGSNLKSVGKFSLPSLFFDTVGRVEDGMCLKLDLPNLACRNQ